MGAAAAVFLGAGVGALLRWVLGLWLNPLIAFLPLGTLAANLLGGLLVGVAVGGLNVETLSHWTADQVQMVRLLLITGFLGGLTTFSTFSAEVVESALRGQWMQAAGIAALHLAGSLLLTALGLALAQFSIRVWAG